MKHKGSILDFTFHRNDELLTAFIVEMRQCRHIYMPDIARRAVLHPTSRFWVSAQRARNVVNALLSGQPALEGMRPNKREMFEEIFHRFLALRDGRPGVCTIDLVSEIVHSPAPRFYMSPSRAIAIIEKIKNGYYERLCAEGRRYNC